MSYCVYVLLTPEEAGVMEKFLSDPKVKEIFQTRFPDYMEMPQNNGFTYMAEAHRGLPHVGYHYSLGFEEAHTFCLWAAQTFGKPGYIYDGDEEYQAPMEKKVVVPGSTTLLKLLKCRLRGNLEKFVEELTRRWNQLNSEIPGFPPSKITRYAE